MTKIFGTSFSERIDEFGTYYWDGTSWVFLTANSTTAGFDSVYGAGGNDSIYGGGGNDALFGGRGVDLLFGGTGDDKLYGGVGADTAYGGAGNDTYFIDDVAAVVSETDSATGLDDGGVDLVSASVSYTLGAFVENLKLTGIGDLSGTGNELNNILRGNVGDNHLAGLAGADALYGAEGNDGLEGGDGNDTLYGGWGNDILVGGGGADRLYGDVGGNLYVFNAVGDSRASLTGAFSGATGDVINGFMSTAETADIAARDKIDFTSVATEAGHELTWTGGTASGYGVWHSNIGRFTFVYVDTTGDLVADLSVKIVGNETLNASDFIGVSSVESTPPTVSSTAYGTTDGTLRAGDTVTISVTFSENVMVAGGTPSLSLNSGGLATYVSGSGTDILTFSYTVADGENAVDLAIAGLNLNSATIKDAAGNSADLSGVASNPTGTLAIDTTAPAAGVLSLTGFADTGSSANDGITQDNSFDLSLAGNEAASSVGYEVSTDGGASWSATTASQSGLADGSYQFRAVVSDAVGNSANSDAISVSLDSAAPAAGVLSFSGLTDSGSSASDQITQDNSFVLSLAGNEAASSVGYEVSTDGGATWSATTASQSALADGPYQFRAVVSDAAGNSAASNAVSVTVDTTAPAQATITGYSDDTGGLGDGVTQDTTLVISGTSAANATIRVFDGALLGQTTADASGNWSFATGILALGNHSFTATATDLAGNGGPTSPGLDVRVGLDMYAATMTASEGFRIFGADPGDLAGRSVSNAGDINGDGFDDMIISAYGGDGSANTKTYAGEAIVVFGKATGFSNVDVSAANFASSGQGFRIFGADAYDMSGWSASTAGDINGDGFDDLIIGARGGDGSANTKNYSGEAIVVFGKATGFSDVDVSAANFASSGQGFRIFGADVGDKAGNSVSNAGDINGDGFDDLIIGAPDADGSTNNTITKGSAGEAIVVFGKATGFADVDVSAANFVSSGQGFRIFGADLADGAGYSVSAAGDVNGDGFDDLIIGVRLGDGSANTKANAGEAIVVFGKATGFSDVDVSAANFASSGQGFRIFGADSTDEAGISVSTAGDINGDGFDDLIIGVRLGDGPADAKSNAGEAIVVFGKATGFGDVDVAAADFVSSGQGFRIFGADPDDQSGQSVSSAGDINGDGFDDLIIGATGGDGSTNTKAGAGEAMVVFGKATGFGDVDVSAANFASSGQGFRIFGADVNDLTGRAVSSAGDINGDGFDDLIIGAYRSDGSANTKTDAGEAIVVFGGNFTGNVVFAGTNGDDVLTGTTAAETFVGGQGNDTMTGNGGADAFQGGVGDDTVILGSSIPLNTDGGSGIDTVNFDLTGASIDLTGLNSSRFTNIEKIDLTGSNANKLLIDKQAVIDMMGSNGDAFTDRSLLIKGDASDLLSLLDGWTNAGTLVNPAGETGSYILYTNGAANLIVESDIQVLTGAIDAATMTAAQGFRIFGADGGDWAGYSVSSAGDINGDGFDDLIIGARNGDGSANTKANPGEAVVVFGKATGFGNVDVSAANFASSGQGFRIFGADAGDQAGHSVSNAGDINGDGFDDLIIGAFGDGSANTKTDAGEAIVVFGKATGFGDVDVSAADFVSSGKGFRIFGADTGDYAGYSVSSSGDINGDGFDDLIIGAFRGDGSANTKTGAGEAIVVFGKATGFSNVDVSAANFASSGQGFRIFGADGGDSAGCSVSSAGDVNGDGFDDLIIGAIDGDGSANTKVSAGEAIVVFGKATGFGDVDVSATNFVTSGQGFRIFGADILDLSGSSVSSAGDINGDGFDDLIVGARSADGSTNTKGTAGEAIVVFGKATGFGDADVSAANFASSGQGFRIFGADADDRAGISVSSAGDINGDGFDDLIIGAKYGDGSANSKYNAGEAIVVFGKATGFADVDVSAADFVSSGQGFRVFGADSDDRAGCSVSSAGDINGDGFDDLIIGAFAGDGSANTKNYSGEAIVVFGGNFLGGVIFAGTNASDLLTGTAAAETFVGGQGNDTMLGNGGADAFQGGAGDDTVAVIGTSALRIDGGSGFDTLRLDGAGDSFDFATILPAKITSIEAIDLTGTGNNSLSLGAQDVFDLSEGTYSGITHLTIQGNNGDSISTYDTGWTNLGTTTIGADTFQIFLKGQAELFVDTDIAWSGGLV